MSDRTDLTRWNRAGLSRITYVDGNAVEYLELLRQQLAEKFGDVNWIRPAEAVPENELPVDGESLLEIQKKRHLREQRLLQMYHQDRQDWAWEISRTFARACHILTGYSDAWINEGYLDTATQWDNVRRLVALLGYNPAPPASATTPLVLMAKEGKSGTVEKGFQVKNNPPKAADKVVFETLEDLFIDASMNGMRPKGWDKSDTAAIGDSAADGQPFSELALLPAVDIQGIGAARAALLESRGIGKISDFFEVDPESLTDTGIGLNRLWEFKAKAMTVCNFQPGAEWAAVSDWSLPDIVVEDSATLAELSGNSVADTEALQLDIAMLGACLDEPVYQGATLKQLQVTSSVTVTGSVLSPWRAHSKPQVEPGQVVLVYHQSDDLAEAATVEKVDKKSKDIHLLPSPVQYSWNGWPLSDAVLRVVPRWSRKCWLNGDDVIHTVEAHGLTAGAYICWKDKSNAAQYHYAEVLKADRQTLQLKLGGNSSPMPDEGTEIMVALPVATLTLSADYQPLNADAAGVSVTGIGLETATEADLPFRMLKVYPTSGPSYEPPKVPGVSDPIPPLPPASLPGLGSFLFPSPFLPVELVKAAIEMMLTLGLMVIPSTGEPVFKGMPLSGLLQGLSIEDAAAKLLEVLNSLKMPVKYKWKDDLLVEEASQDPPAYLEAAFGPHVSTAPNRTYVDADGNVIPMEQVNCTKGKVTSGGKLLGYQPKRVDLPEFSGQPDRVPFDLNAVAWKPEIVSDDDKKKEIQNKLEKASDAASTNIHLEVKEAPGAASGGEPPEQLLAVLPQDAEVKAVVAPRARNYLFDGTADKIESGDWIAGQFSDGPRALKVKSIEEFHASGDGRAFSVKFENIVGDEGMLEKIYADFRAELEAENSQYNKSKIEADFIELDSVPATLTPGRKVMLKAGGDLIEAIVVKIHDNGIETKPSASGYEKGELIVYGNVVAVGHGVGKPTKILGSGSAARSNQEFTLEVSGISFVPDETMSSGVAAAIDVVVDGRIWEQVSTLRDSAADDHHYAIRMTEEGFIRIVFGDGINGRRLPSGRNNVLVRYREGTGLAGNVDAHSLEKIVNQHPLVDSVLQPVHASGGGNMEDISSLRENAPKSLLALERAVSLSDFVALATSRSNIWQASAASETRNISRMEKVTVTIVPAGGAKSPKVEDDVRKFLQSHALPGVQVLVRNFDSIADFSIDIVVRIDKNAFLPEAVMADVTQAVKDCFKLQNRKLGASLFLSEVYKIVEGVRGVENSVCHLYMGGEDLQLIPATNMRTVVYLKAAGLKVDYQEYRP